MTLHSYKLIAVEYSGKERELEQAGHSQGDAARRLGLSDSHLIRVLNGNPEARGENNPYRKVCWFRQGHEPHSTEIGQAIMAARLDTAKMVLDQLGARGIRLTVMKEEHDGVLQHTIAVRPPGEPTPEDLEEIEAHKDSLIALLNERAAATKAVQPVERPKNGARKTQRSMIEAIIPELPPTSFLRYDVERLLHKHGEHALADSTTALDNLLSDFTRRGQFERIKPGTYRVKSSTTESNETLPPENETSQSGSAPAPSSTTSSAPTDTPPSNGSVPSSPLALQETLLGLAAQMSAGSVDESMIQAVDQAVDNLQTDIFSIVEKVVDPIRALTQQLRTMNAIRTQLLTHLTSPKN